MKKVIELGSRIEEIESHLRKLSLRASGAFCCCLSERLSSIYPVFATKEKWGDPLLLRDTLDLTWAFLKGADTRRRLNIALEKVQSGTPHAESFPSVEGVCAQNVCIAVDIAVRLCLEEPGTEPLAAEYGFEALKAAICNKETGYIDLGSGPKAREFEARLISHPIVASELQFQTADLQAIETAARRGMSFPVAELEAQAKQNHIEVHKLF